MNLREAISKLSTLPEGATLFAERIAARFRPESRVFVLELTDDELRQPVKDVARSRAPGADYFLEVFIAREVVEGWRANHGDVEPTADQVLECVIFYAENDAYPNSYFGGS